ncbi:MAG: terminase gpA endonuclease subunit [Anaerovoracaceae bacterium]
MSNSALYRRHTPWQIARMLETFAAAGHPPDDIEVDEWAEKTVVLSHRVTARPGQLRLDPYQRFPVRAIKHFIRVVNIWATQTGKTLLVQIFLAWCAKERPGPSMYSGPDKEFVTRRSRRHIQPIFEDSPELRKLLTGNRHDWTLYQYNLTTCNITLAWAGSPAQMAGEPIMNLARDEIDKWRDATEKEANSFRLVGRRTGSFGEQKRIMDGTTPTTEEADGWQSLIHGTYHEYYVPCPHCAGGDKPFDEDGKRNPGWQVIEIERFRYPKRERGIGDDPEELCDWQVRIRENTRYECRDCGQLIPERHRWPMVMRGDWHPRNPGAPYISTHLPGWYARTTDNDWGNTAARYVEGQEDDQARQDFDNSDAARPYRRVKDNASLALIAHHCDTYERGQLPTDDPCIIIATADIHKRCHFWTVWALTATRNYLLDHGKIETEGLAGLHAIRQQTYESPNGTQHAVAALFPDAEYRSDEVVNLHLEDEFIVPITGSARSGMIRSTTWESYPGSSKLLPHPVQVLNCNDQYFKAELFRRFEKGRQDDGSFELSEADWILPVDVSREFQRHMLGASSVTVKDSRGVERTEIRKTGPDHYLDCAKYALAARVALKGQLREIGAPKPPPGPRVTGQKPKGWDE